MLRPEENEMLGSLRYEKHLPIKMNKKRDFTNNCITKEKLGGILTLPPHRPPPPHFDFGHPNYFWFSRSFR